MILLKNMNLQVNKENNRIRELKWGVYLLKLVKKRKEVY